MTPAELCDLENIVRRATAIRNIALEMRHGNLVDNAEQLLVYAEALLPVNNRFRRDTLKDYQIKNKEN